jgi:hypothetical protein
MPYHWKDRRPYYARRTVKMWFLFEAHPDGRERVLFESLSYAEVERWRRDHPEYEQTSLGSRYEELEVLTIPRLTEDDEED